MDITEALAQTLRAEKAIRKVSYPKLAAAAGIARHSAMRKFDGKRETSMRELRGFARAMGTTAAALMADAETRLEKAGEEPTPEVTLRTTVTHSEATSSGAKTQDDLDAEADRAERDARKHGRVKNEGRSGS